jgi:acyl-CoA reductase-like NAD-dependent aldehyde dehydrogenase
MDRARLLAERLRTGTTWINDANAVAQDDRAPFGGFRQSGLGRELGVEGLLEFTEAHTVTYPA